jgi:hypothetical protein
MKQVDIWESDIEKQRGNCSRALALLGAMSCGVPALPERMQKPYADGVKEVRRLLGEVDGWLDGLSFKVRYAQEVED